VMDGCTAITIVSDFVEDRPRLSATLNVTVEDPAAAGVPVIAPVEEFRLSGLGSVPEVIDQVKGAVPPDSVRVWLYAMPASPPGRDAVVIDGAALMVTAKAFVGAAPAASVTLIVKLDVAAAVGVPLRTPADDNVRPAGTDPALTDHINGAVPPLDAKVWE